jgi:hypothetical protein
MQKNHSIKNVTINYFFTLNPSRLKKGGHGNVCFHCYFTNFV